MLRDAQGDRELAYARGWRRCGDFEQFEADRSGLFKGFWWGLAIGFVLGAAAVWEWF